MISFQKVLKKPYDLEYLDSCQMKSDYLGRAVKLKILGDCFYYF